MRPLICQLNNYILARLLRSTIVGAGSGSRSKRSPGIVALSPEYLYLFRSADIELIDNAAMRVAVMRVAGVRQDEAGDRSGASSPWPTRLARANRLITFPTPDGGKYRQIMVDYRLPILARPDGKVSRLSVTRLATRAIKLS